MINFNQALTAIETAINQNTDRDAFVAAHKQYALKGLHAGNDFFQGFSFSCDHCGSLSFGLFLGNPVIDGSDRVWLPDSRGGL